MRAASRVRSQPAARACHDRNLADRPAALGAGPRRAGARRPTPDATDRRRARAVKNPPIAVSASPSRPRCASCSSAWPDPHSARQPFVTGPAGKPALADRSLQFSLSHVEGYALIGLTRAGDIGVDLERDRPLRLSAAPPRRADRRRHGPRRQTLSPAASHRRRASCRPGAAWKPSPRRAASASAARWPTSACAAASRARPPRSKLQAAQRPRGPASPCATSRSAAASTQPSPSRMPPACGRRRSPPTAPASSACWPAVCRPAAAQVDPHPPPGHKGAVRSVAQPG